MSQSESTRLAVRKRTIIALRLVMTLAVTAVALSSVEAPSITAIVVLGVYAATNVVLFFERAAHFVRRLSEMMLFTFDLAVIVLLMVLSGELNTEFFVTFFMIVLMAGHHRLSLRLRSSVFDRPRRHTARGLPSGRFHHPYRSLLCDWHLRGVHGRGSSFCTGR